MSKKAFRKNRVTMAMRYIIYSFVFVLFFHIHSNLSGQSFLVSISSQGSTEICLGDSVEASILVYGGSAPYTVVINDNEGEYTVLENIESPYTFYIKPEFDNTYYIASAVDRRGRKGLPYGSISVVVKPSTPVSIVLDRTVFLVTEPGFPLISDPAGATFEGIGVSENVFYPAVATSVGSPHLISCNYINPNGCISKDHVNIYVLSGEASVYLLSGDDTVQNVCDNGSSFTIKGSNEDNLPGTFELFRANSGILVPDHISDDDLTDNEAELLLTGLMGAFKIVYTYGMEEVEISASTIFTANDNGVNGILNLPETICKNDLPFPLIPDVDSHDPNSIFTFSGPGVSGNQSDGFFLDPGNPDVPLGLCEIVLVYTNSSGCTSELTETVDVGLAPEVSFLPDQICLATEGGNISFNNLTSHKDQIANWSWEFGDPASGMNNTSHLENPEHFYAEPGIRMIVLGATTYHGCFAQHELDTLLVDQPVADFTWINDCYSEDQATTFLASPVSVYSDLDTLIWTIRTTEGNVLEVIGKGPAEFTLDHSFSSLNQYDVTLFVENEAGCQGELTKRIELLPVHVLNSDGYFETFNDLASGWSTGSEDLLDSWILNEPDFAGFIQTENDKAWYTDLPDHTGNYLEHSWVRSPCFDLSGLSNPVIQLNIMKSFRPGMDGAVIQHQDQVNPGWNTLGTYKGGLNWYNDSAINNEPGGSSIGWGLVLPEPDNEWVTARHSLDILAGNPLVKFRVAVATSGSHEIIPGVFNQGFAFDNFVIGDALIRRSVLEYFTNASGDSIYTADSIVKSFAMDHAGIVYDLHYHMDYPEDDPMNMQNPYPPSTRAFNYGVPVVPFAVLNGGVTPEYRFNLSSPIGELDDELLKAASLETPLFGLSLSVDYLENRLEGNATVICLDDSFDSYLQLYIVVIEKEVTAYPGLNQGIPFRNVVLDMLPSTGILLGDNWSSGSKVEKDFNWDYPNYIEDVEDLCVVAFIQDRDINNRWIFQADAVAFTPDVGTPGISDEQRSLMMYPNPATDFLTIYFKNRTENESQLVLVDISGREVMKTVVQKGSTMQQLDISHLSEGMFMVFLKESGIFKEHAKLIRYR